jgi:hypothetical protein
MEELNNIDKEKEFQEACEAAIKYLAENHSPHSIIIIDNCKAELFDGTMVYNTEKYIID